MLIWRTDLVKISILIYRYFFGLCSHLALSFNVFSTLKQLTLFRPHFKVEGWSLCVYAHVPITQMKTVSSEHTWVIALITLHYITLPVSLQHLIHQNSHKGACLMRLWYILNRLLADLHVAAGVIGLIPLLTKKTCYASSFLPVTCK